MVSDGQYRVVHMWAEQERLWTNTAMVRELLQALEQDRLNNSGVVKKTMLLDGLSLEFLYEREAVHERTLQNLKQQVWLKALELGWLPLEQPQVEQREESTFGRPAVRITVSMRCDDSNKKEG